MIDKCIYRNLVHLENFVCEKCNLYLNTCIPIVTTDDGYSACSECDCYLCEGCRISDCIYKTYINL